MECLLLLSFLLHMVVIQIPSAYGPDQTVTVDGEVKGITSRKEGDHIYSYVSFLVHKIKNGPSSLSNRHLTIKHFGGELAGKLIWRSHQPYFFVGEFAEVTLEPEDQVFRVAGGRKGKVSLDQTLQQITQRTVSGYKLIWYKPVGQWQDSTARPGADWYGPAKWPSATFNYWINTANAASGVSASSFITYVGASFQTWQDDLGSSVTFTYSGDTTNTPEVSDNTNVVGWGFIGGGTIAEATIWASY